MTRFLSLIVLAAGAVAFGMPVEVQQKRASPHETVSSVIDGSRITITYGRPYAKDRKIWGGLVPYNQAWRTGADEATTLITQRPLKFGDTTIPAGAHTLYTVPTDKGGKLVFGKSLGGWGIPVDTKNDLAQVDMKRDTVEKAVDQFTITVGKAKDGGGVLKFIWDSAEYSAPFTVVKK